MPILTKPATCHYCKASMAAGEPFAWHEGKRAVACADRSHTGAPMAGYIGSRPVYSPRHVHDCITPKMEANRAAEIDKLMALAAAAGATAEQIAALRAVAESQ